MKAESLIRDPVFQLNPLIWMAKEQPAENPVVRPLFHEHGFSMVYVEQPFPLPPELVGRIRRASVAIGERPEPELILGRLSDRRGLYFEAKAESFGPESSTARQARAHLLATGASFAEVMAPCNEALLCHVTPDDRVPMMTACLTKLHAGLTDSGFQPGLSLFMASPWTAPTLSIGGTQCSGDSVDWTMTGR